MLKTIDVKPELLPAVQVSGLYVHIPFCFHKCHYCDFYSITRQNVERMNRFVERVLTEAEIWSRAGGPEIRPKTVFFGGGTPSLLPAESMSRLIQGLRQRFDVAPLEEWTIEVNPATASAEYLGMLRQLGVNRLSFGAQSFDRADLKTLERHHDPVEVGQSIEMARRAGFERLNIDLIYAIPGQSFDSWCRSLEAAILLGLTHYSCYGLTYEANTPMAVKKRLGLLHPAAEELELRMFHHARHRLQQIGCPAYEISNYASAGQECLHNLLYWTGGSYVGLGPSAASHIQGYRFKNLPHLGEWEEKIDGGSLPATDLEHLPPQRRAEELAMLGLRLARGLEFDDFSARTGFDARILFEAQIDQLTRLGLIECDNHRLRLTEAGLNVADGVSGEFIGLPAECANRP